METMKLQKKVTASAMLDPKILVPAITSSPSSSSTRG